MEHSCRHDENRLVHVRPSFPTHTTVGGAKLLGSPNEEGGANSRSRSARKRVPGRQRGMADRTHAIRGGSRLRHAERLGVTPVVGARAAVRSPCIDVIVQVDRSERVEEELKPENVLSGTVRTCSRHRGSFYRSLEWLVLSDRAESTGVPVCFRWRYPGASILRIAPVAFWLPRSSAATRSIRSAESTPIPSSAARRIWSSSKMRPPATSGVVL